MHALQEEVVVLDEVVGHVVGLDVLVLDLTRKATFALPSGEEHVARRVALVRRVVPARNLKAFAGLAS